MKDKCRMVAFVAALLFACPVQPARAQGASMADAPSAASGAVAPSKRAAFTREPNMDRSGNDMRKVELLEADTVAQCEKLCRLAAGCLAFTFVKRSDTVPRPVCRLKDTVPTAYESSCCTSGVLTK
ncbi:MAG: PAN domain-containing protein [Hyphomicrobiaceae bacterium]